MAEVFAVLLSKLWNYILQMLFTLPVLFIAFPIHECAHGLTAYALGDDTAKRAGRLTLNPFRHLDPLGTILLVVARFGWAKPVPINPWNFKNRKADMALTAFAGPLSNLLMAFLSLALLRIFYYPVAPSGLPIPAQFLFACALINVGLFVFNLIPIPPLDGSRIVALFLPDRIEAFYYRYGSVLQIVLILFILWGSFTGPLVQMQYNVINKLMALLGMNLYLA